LPGADAVGREKIAVVGTGGGSLSGPAECGSSARRPLAYSYMRHALVARNAIC
jgi:hypothetical protein